MTKFNLPIIAQSEINVQRQAQAQILAIDASQLEAGAHEAAREMLAQLAPIHHTNNPDIVAWCRLSAEFAAFHMEVIKQGRSLTQGEYEAIKAWVVTQNADLVKDRLRAQEYKAAGELYEARCVEKEASRFLPKSEKDRALTEEWNQSLVQNRDLDWADRFIFYHPYVATLVVFTVALLNVVFLSEARKYDSEALTPIVVIASALFNFTFTLWGWLRLIRAQNRGMFYHHERP